MKRMDFLRNAMMALAISFVPKILQPLLPEVITEEMVDVKIKIHFVTVGDNPQGGITYSPSKDGEWTMRVSKKQAEYMKSIGNPSPHQ